MADRSTQLVLEALQRAASQPGGTPLLGKNALFPSTAAGKAAAQHCLVEKLLQIIRTETRGKTKVEVCQLTSAGLAYLVDQSSPRQVLEGLVQALEARQDQVDALVAVARQAREELKELHASAEKVLDQLKKELVARPAVTPQPKQLQDAILTHLDMWQAAGALDDFPLPELYDRVNRAATMTIGQFHDALRTLCEQKRIYLHPWTGPLYSLPHPEYALLIGHQVAYYASLRGAQVSISA
jgi:hypothetical protein